MDGFSQKLDFLREHGRDTDTIFIGSSRFYRGISPRVFDEEMTALGRPTHSFNFGLDAMMLPESAYVLDRVLAQKLPHLQWVFMELDDLHLKPWPAHRGTQRLLYWHDWERTKNLLSKSGDWSEKEKLKRHLARAWELREFIKLHLKEFLRRATNVGAGATLAADRLDPSAQDQPALGPDHDGFGPARSSLPPRQRASYRNDIAQAARAPVGHAADRYAEKVWKDCAARVRDHGATLVFIVPPAFPIRSVRFAKEASAPGPVLAFADLHRYPELYRTQMRSDPDHLNEQGAKIFTRLVAEKFAGEVADKRIP